MPSQHRSSLPTLPCVQPSPWRRWHLGPAEPCKRRLSPAQLFPFSRLQTQAAPVGHLTLDFSGVHWAPASAFSQIWGSSVKFSQDISHPSCMVASGQQREPTSFGEMEMAWPWVTPALASLPLPWGVSSLLPRAGGRGRACRAGVGPGPASPARMGWQLPSERVGTLHRSSQPRDLRRDSRSAGRSLPACPRQPIACLHRAVAPLAPHLGGPHGRRNGPWQRGRTERSRKGSPGE